MSSFYSIDLRSSLTYDLCARLTLENDGAKLVVIPKDSPDPIDPPYGYEKWLSYCLTDGKNYLHLRFAMTRGDFRVCSAESYGGNQVSDLLDIVGKSKWIG